MKILLIFVSLLLIACEGGDSSGGQKLIKDEITITDNTDNVTDLKDIEITLSTNGGVFSNGATTIILKPDNYLINATNLEKPTKTGRIFLGWGIDKTILSKFEKISIKNDITFYALWDDPAIANISTVNDLKNIDCSTDYELINNIDLNNIPWTHLCIDNYTGTFNGNKFQIKNLYINQDIINNPELAPNMNYGLFARIGLSGVIENLHVNGNILTNIAGIIAGINFGEIRYSSSSGSCNSSFAAGGIVAGNLGVIRNSYSTASVKSRSGAGGITADNRGTIASCYSTGAVSASSFAGGIASTNKGYISLCYSTSDVRAVINYAGGIAGMNTKEIDHSFAINKNITAYYEYSRITNTDTGSIIFFNYGSERLPYATSNPHHKDGENISIHNIKSSAFWIGRGFTDDWDISNGKLPRLKGVNNPDNLEDAFSWL